MEQGATSSQPAKEPSGKTGVPLRILAVIVALLLAGTSAAIIAGASDNTSLPTCRDVSRGKAQPSSSGDCFKGSTRRADAGLVFAIGGGVAMAVALVLSIMLAATGERGRLFLIFAAAGVILMGLEIAVIHI